ncbi:alpha/beta hydrolase [Mycolicibacterium thermoresistibile]
MTSQDLPAMELLAIPMAAGGRLDVYSGVARLAGKLWASCHRPPTGSSRTAVLIVHPTSNFLGHYALEPLARRGITAVGMNTRYLGNDSALITENCVLDVGAGVRYLKDHGFDKVVLMGNSGGGGLVSLYQSQAEKPSITATPAGDPPDLTQADLPAADGVICAMAHPGRAAVYTEWLDPAIIDEQRPFERDPSLDAFNPDNGPPFSAEFIARYRQAQVDRNRRITAWVRDQLDRLATADTGVADLPFTVHGTCADLRFLDPSIEPSDREPQTLWGDPWVANYLPASLGHNSSLRSWLSQWSIDDSNADGPHHLGRVSVPVLVAYGSADNAAFPAHAKALYDGVGHADKELVEIAGANHYFKGQPELLDQFCDTVVDWLERHDLR